MGLDLDPPAVESAHHEVEVGVSAVVAGLGGARGV